MIITTTINLFINMFTSLLNLIPQLPLFPQIFIDKANQYLDIIFEFGNLIMFFLPPVWLLEILIYYSIALEIFVIGYYALMWFLGKIPIINIH